MSLISTCRARSLLFSLACCQSSMFPPQYGRPRVPFGEGLLLDLDPLLLERRHWGLYAWASAQQRTGPFSRVNR